MIVNRSQEERDAIAAEVKAARGAQPITRSAAQAGITPVTWRRIEAGQTVREDRLELVSAWVGDRTHKPPQSVTDATDEQLLAELGRRLAARHQGVGRGSSMNADPDDEEQGVRVTRRNGRTRVRVESAPERSRTDQPKGP